MTNLLGGINKVRDATIDHKIMLNHRSKKVIWRRDIHRDQYQVQKIDEVFKPLIKKPKSGLMSLTEFISALEICLCVNEQKYSVELFEKDDSLFFHYPYEVYCQFSTF